MPDPPGWYPDPQGHFETRYWDGSAWTQAVMKDGSVDTDATAFQARPALVPTGGSSDPRLDTSGIPADMAPPPSPTDRMTSLAPGEAQARVSQMLAMAGITVSQSVPGRLEGSVEIKGEPNWMIVVVLLFLWLIPGIIYWYLKSKPENHRVGLLFVPVATGTRIVIQAPAPVMERLMPILGQLPW